MYLVLLLLFVHSDVINCKRSNKIDTDVEPDDSEEDLMLSESDKPFYHYVPASTLVPPDGIDGINTQFLPYSLGKLGYSVHEPPASVSVIPTFATQVPTNQQQSLETILASNPLLAALILSSSLGIPSTSPAAHASAAVSFNHPQHLPINPYVALLLSHYGRYINLPFNRARGLYGYSASNNYHNNKPFGAYKIYEDRDI